MSPIVVVTGAPGTGKTTLAAYLAKAVAHGLHIPADLFFTFPAHPISPYRATAHEQNTDIMIALAQTAATFAARGYDVFLDGIFGPWFLPVIAAELQHAAPAVEYVVLSMPLETALNRVRSRSGDGKDHIVRQMHAEFANLGAYAGHTIDAATRTPAELAEEFTRRRAGGAFALDLKLVIASGVA